MTVFAWEAYERGSEVHLQADPTKLELLHKSFKVKKEDFKEKQRDSILEKVHAWHIFFRSKPLIVILCQNLATIYVRLCNISFDASKDLLSRFQYNMFLAAQNCMVCGDLCIDTDDVCAFACHT